MRWRKANKRARTRERREQLRYERLVDFYIESLTGSEGMPVARWARIGVNYPRTRRDRRRHAFAKAFAAEVLRQAVIAERFEQ